MTATARLAPSIALTVIARVWSAGMALVFTPVLLRVLSPEGFGVVSFGVSLQAAFTIIDTALTTTLTRDLARARTRRDVNVAEILRTLEVVYWSAACLFAVVLLALAAPIAKSWFEPATLPQQEISRGLTVMALAFAAQWPLTFYLGGLLASERVIAYTSLVILSSTFRYGGAAVWISQVSPTLTGFFAFQAVSGLAASTVAARLLWKALPNAGKPRVSLDTLRDSWRFTAGMTAISVTMIILNHLDKLVLARMVPLATFGYYSVCALITAALYNVVAPVTTAAFPHLAAAASAQDSDLLSSIYHRVAQYVSLLVFPLAAVLAAYAGPVVGLWTGSEEASALASTILPVLIVAAVMNGVISIPYLLQVASGSTRLTLVSNIVAAHAYLIGLIAGVSAYGIAAAPWVWLAINLCYFVAYVPLALRRLMAGELTRWYVTDVGIPAGGAVLTVGAIRLLQPSTHLGVWQFPAIALCVAAVVMCLLPVGRAACRSLARRATEGFP